MHHLHARLHDLTCTSRRLQSHANAWCAPPNAPARVVLTRSAVAAGQGGGGSDSGGRPGPGGRSSRYSDGHDNTGGLPLSILALATICAAGLYTSLIGLPPGPADVIDTSKATVSVIIPALNEEAGLPGILQAVAALQPPVHEVIVVDGGSTDRTMRIARKGGAKVLRSPKGRARQMNAGAAAASGDLLCFLHADTVPPTDLVSVLRRDFADRRTVLAGFLTSIEVSGKRLWAMTAHHALKTYYPVVLRPVGFMRGLRAVLGDQAQSCRGSDFRRVGGYDDRLVIMEDADMCIRLHHAGPPLEASSTTSHDSTTSRSHTRPGRVKVILDRHVVTSGRRLAAWGDLKATYIHVVISLAWLLQRDPEEMQRLYQQLYTDAYR